jgi:hypothetical protein
VEFLKRKIFGIPMWIVLAVLVIAAFLWYRHKQALAAAASTDGSGTDSSGLSSPASSYDGASYASGNVGAFQSLPYTPAPPSPVLGPLHPVCVQLKTDGSGRCKKWLPAGTPGAVPVRTWGQ